MFVTTVRKEKVSFILDGVSSLLSIIGVYRFLILAAVCFLRFVEHPAAADLLAVCANLLLPARLALC